MTTLLSPATSDYLLPAAPGHLHQDVTEWLSDLEFCQTELAFLAKLLDKAFLRVTSRKSTDALTLLEKKVRNFKEHILQQLTEEFILHERHLAALDTDHFLLNREAIHQEHLAKQLLEKNFMQDVKALKVEIFDLVELQLKRTKKLTKEYEEGNLAL